MKRRGSSRRLLVLVAVIMLLLIAEGALVAFVFVSPSAKEELGGVAESVTKVWEGSEGEPGIRTRAARTAHEAFEEWIVPLWQGPEPPPLDPEFTACIECHPDYATQKKFNVYMNHPLHAELGTTCETCHPQNPHPNPPRPRESVCAECHDQVNNKDECSYCHPPASLPHFYYFGAPKQSVVDCDVCHPQGSFTGQSPSAKVMVGDFGGEDREDCRSCHEDSTCATCHQDVHPANWMELHPDASLGDPTCMACHTMTWCADRCHAVTDINPLQPRPLPSAGVRP